MRKFITAMTVAGAAVVGGQAIAADMPYYPPVIEIPDVDYGIGGSFYLRGSAGLNLHWAREVNKPLLGETYEVNQLGYGYSWGAGFGYETGYGPRFDLTLDSVETVGVRITKADGDPDDGDYTMMLRSTVALANVYYDFSLGTNGFGPSNGGAFGYVGAGAGAAWNQAQVSAPFGFTTPTGTNVTPAAALMAGVGYDMGTLVADLGYRALYLRQINNWPATDPEAYYEIDNSWIHEVRGTLRYRFN